MTIWTPTLTLGRPLYEAIAGGIEADVLAGRLRPGDRLPTHRDLADRLKVTVGTVSRAYAEARKAGWVSGEVGRGTFVLDRAAGRFPSREPAAGEVVDLSLNVPVDSPAPDLAAALRALAAAPDAQSLLRYSLTTSDRDRLAGSAVMKLQGVLAGPDDVALCAGAQHGLGVALDAVVQVGDSILVEELCYPGLRPLATARGLRIVPVPIDDEGLIPDAFDAACRRARPRALYTVPTLHNPTNATMSLKRRQALVEIARRRAVTIIEDDIYRMLAPDTPPPLAHLAPEQTVYVTSLSKVLAPGLRLGYLVAPEACRARVTRAIQDSIWMVSPIAAALATRWVLGGEFEAIAAAKRKEAAARQALAATLLFRKPRRPTTASYHLWLPTRRSAEAVAFEAQASGVVVTPSSSFYLGSGSAPAAVRVSLSAARDRAVLKTALEKLRDVLDSPAPNRTARL